MRLARLASVTLALFSCTMTAARANPGDLISATPIAAPAHTRAWKILYETANRTGAPRVASAVIIAPDAPLPFAGRPVVAWGHPTTGVAEYCAPSEQADFFTTIPELSTFAARGYVIAAADYPGLGTAGIHPYLVGESEGRSIIDAVRAARHLTAAGASNRYALWGYSQGAQGVLYAGQMASAYAPDLHLVGIAAIAPPTALDRNLHDDISDTMGRMFASYAIYAWSNLYNTPAGRITPSDARPFEVLVARQCIENVSQTLESLATAYVLSPRMLLPTFWSSQPWEQLLRVNSAVPQNIHVPMLIAQGTADHIVAPSTTQAFVDAACKGGVSVEFVWLEGTDHLRAGDDSAATVLDWIGRRFDGDPQTGCTTRGVFAPTIGLL
jgi:alpha-beta hydrolase superfamily lysophospholipase